MCKHPAGLVQGIRGPPAPVVEFLPDAPATLIESITGQVHDVEGIHNCPCIGEFFSGGGACSIVCVSVFLFERIDA